MTTALREPMTLPRVREGLTIQSISPTEYVVKRADSREYFSVGPQEACLLEMLDGQHSFGDIQATFEHHFQTSLSENDLQQFIEAVEPMGLFRPPTTPGSNATTVGTSNVSDKSSRGEKTSSGASANSQVIKEDPSPAGKKFSLRDQSLLYFRIPLCDPDVFLGKLVKVVPFIWTRGFMVVAACLIVLALSITVSSSAQLAAGVQDIRGLGDAICFIFVIIVCTSMHETAHGATLKHFGGEVHDSGLMFMFFTPCMYANVSDAWLLPDKWKRLAITAAGAICDLCVWALAVFVWRLTVPGVLINKLALFTMTMCGARSLMNFNPLLRLDGYYLLSDWLSIPNLRPRAMDYWMGYMRWFLWGAARPPWVPEHGKLLSYGFICWFFALTFLNVVFVQFFEYMGGQFGVTGLVLVCLLLSLACQRVFKGLFESELSVMLRTRHGRTTIWAVGILAALGLLFLVPVRSTTSGDFEVRPGNVVQVHVQVPGIVEQIFVEDGCVVEEGQLIAELKSSSLESDIVKTEDVVREVEANLRRLKSGARPEELEAAQDRVRRLTEWYELGAEELEQAKLAHEQELLVQDHRIREITAELENARQDIAHSENLYRQGALAGAQLRQQRLQVLQIESRLAQTQASMTATKATGVKAKQAEIARRAQELEDAKDRLDLLKAGSRPEEIAAEEARLERASHELAFQKSRREKLKLVAPTSGIFSAPRLMERIGLALMQDSLFCTIEKPETSRVEIAVSEDEAVLLKPGQPVSLKARAIPFETFEATVEGISATALKGTTGENSVIVHCQIQNPDGRLKSGMTGFGRVTRGWNTIGVMLLTKGIRYLRTEFWW